MTALATVLIPTWDAVETLGAALASARAQTLTDIEILVVSDGAKPETLALARAQADEDPRIRVLDLPKAEGRGERNRHAGVLAAQAPAIVYLADDDLLLPRHVELLVDALATNDLVQSRNGHIAADGHLHIWAADLSSPEWHAFHLTDPPTNRTSITGTAHTAEAYRRLRNGWVIPAPGMWADLTLWREFLRLPDVRAATLPDVTTIQFPASVTPKDAAAAAAYRAPWAALLELPDAHERMQELAAEAEHRQLMRAELKMRALTLRSAQLETERDALRSQVSAAQSAVDDLTQRATALEHERGEFEGIASAARLAARKHRERAARFKRERDATRASLSWRVTAPLRAVRRRVGRLRR